MKILIVGFLFTLSYSSPALQAADNSEKKNNQYGGVIAEDSTLSKILTVPGVEPIYKKCQDDYKSDLAEVPNCIWKLLGDQQKEKVQEIYASEENSKKDPAQAQTSKGEAVDVTAGKSVLKNNFTGKDFNVKNDYKSDPAVVALSNFFGKKLDEVLNGSEEDKKAKKITTVDHKKFISLFTSEVGKSVINAFTSYCMETKSECRSGTKPICLIPETDSDRKAAIDKNLKELRTATFSKDEGELWTKCIADVPKVCYETDKTSASADRLYSQRRACIVMDFVKSARKSLIAADEQSKFYDGLLGGGDRGPASIASNMKVIDDDKKMSADNLTQITSADIDKEFKNSKNDKVIAEADECVKTPNDEKCSKFLSTDTEKNSNALVELGLKQSAKGLDLEKKLENNKNVEAYLKEEGFSEEEIKKLTSNEDEIKNIKEQIKKRYDAEKEAIIKEMAEKITKKTSSEDGKIGANDQSKIDIIKKELSDRNQNFKNLIHFTNIVSSYLNIEDEKTKKQSRNTASLYSEVKSYKGPDDEALKENLKKNKDLQESDASTKLDVGTINSNFLQYNKKQPNSNGQP